MMTFYFVLVIILFILAISDLIVGVSNDAVNFLNSAMGSKAASFKLILGVAALGIIVGCTFSSGMMEVARKGIFHPEYFHFSEIILLFLAVMVTDVILLDTFNTFGMPTSTTVSIVFELLGAAVAFSLIKIYTDPDALGLGQYINSGKALAIISGILLSVIVAFSAGVIVQYLTRLLFSFDYSKSLNYFGGIWGGLAIAAITYFMLIKGAQGTSFMDNDMKAFIHANAFNIIALSFAAWAVILQICHSLFNFDILKFVVLVGTFALAMAFAGNDLVNFIGVPLAGYNSYELYANGGQVANEFLMTGLAEKIPTPTVLLLLAGIIMTLTLWLSKKAKSVVKTSLDLGRQYEGTEKFNSFAVSRALVRNSSKLSGWFYDNLPSPFTKYIGLRFDERPFVSKQANLGREAPAFDMIRAATTLIVSSILIAIGTSLKLPLSTTYVTFMVFMGTSLADGAWGRESAVYRVSGVLSVIGGWFFTAFFAFTAAFIVANIFYFGGNIAIFIIIALAGYVIYRTHRYHGKKILVEQEDAEIDISEGTLDRSSVLELNAKTLTKYLTGFSQYLEETIQGLEKEDLGKLSKSYKKFRALFEKAGRLQGKANDSLDRIEDDKLDVTHLYVLTADYIFEIGDSVNNVMVPSLNHVDNNHKPLTSDQIGELKEIQVQLNQHLMDTLEIFNTEDQKKSEEFLATIDSFTKLIRTTRKKQIKRIKNHEIGMRNSLLYFSQLGELRNIGWILGRLVKAYYDLILLPEESEDAPIS